MMLGEVVRLEVDDLDFSLGGLFIRSGQGRKDRVVPLGGCRLYTFRGGFIKDGSGFFGTKARKRYS